jgi:hypothetical protein
VPSEIQPIDVFDFIVDDEICNFIVEETNRYAEQKIISGITAESLTPSAKLTMERCEYK